MTKKIIQSKPIFGIEEREALNSYMEQGGWITEFQKTAELEDMITRYTGAKHCFMVNNGTVSLTLSALACGISAGDEVIIPNYTMVATPNSIELIGAKPIFVDVDRETLCIDFDQLKSKYTSKTKAVMLVSANGRHSKSINEIRKFCTEKEIFLIEDAAQSLGSFYPNGKHIGTVGDVGSFSFSPAKIISTGQGGAVVTNNSEIAKKVKYLKDFGRSKGGNDIHEYIGYNFKFTDIQAVIGIEQMKKLDDRIISKKNIYTMYSSLLPNNSNFKIIYNDINYTAPWFIELIAEKRDELMKYLEKNHIGTRPMYPPINKQKAYNETTSLPVSEMIGTKGLWLPSSVDLNEESIQYVVDKIAKFYQ